VAQTLVREFEETELALLSPSSKGRMLAEKVNGKAYKFEGDRHGLF
jgi:hypothetical protein